MASPTLLVRARDDEGRFLPDDPTTPENEAWVAVTAENNDTTGAVG